jgi:regulator of sigma E protease
MSTDILVFLVVLGVLVFVHEAGHFFAAKMCGVYVDRFSLGMPPRIFGFKWGDTDYCIGLLPIGGYVKMAGQEDAPLSDEDREATYGHVPSEQWYNKKTKLQRAFILLAGPFMNLVLAFFIYAGMGGFGQEIEKVNIETRIGLIQPGSPAETAPVYSTPAGENADFSGDPDGIGWRTGDRIVSIDQKPVDNFQDITVHAILGENKVATVEIERLNAQGEPERYLSLIEPKRLNPDEPASRYGIQPYFAALIQHVLPDSPAAKHGLQADDIILSADGVYVDSKSFSEMTQGSSPEDVIDLVVLRGDEKVSMTLNTRQDGAFKDIYFSVSTNPEVGIGDLGPQKIHTKDSSFNKDYSISEGEWVQTINGETVIGTTLRRVLNMNPQQEVTMAIAAKEDGTPRSIQMKAVDAVRALSGFDPDAQPSIIYMDGEDVAKETGLQRKDVLLEIDGQPATAALLKEIQDTRIGETVSVKAKRPAMFFGLAQKEETIEGTLTVTSIQQIGVLFGPEMVFHKEKPADVIPYAWNECRKRVSEIGVILKNLVTGNLSPKLLGGPVMIYEVTTATARMGLYELLNTVAMISVNLAIFNLLPLPVLDGGQLTIIGVEAIRRRPVSIQVLERVQQFGVLFIIGLMLFVTFNDISRVVERFLP